jgi:threonine/homoserine/homoserine lactone efflux protein
MLTFALAVFLLIITPGPGVLSTAGVGAAYGFQPGLRYVMGLFIGTNLVGLAVISGLAAIVFSVPVVRGVLMAASLAYLVYLAGRIALAGSKLAFIDARRRPGVKDGILLQIINPKAYAVNSALYSGFAFSARQPAAGNPTETAYRQRDLVSYPFDLAFCGQRIASARPRRDNAKANKLWLWQPQ